MAMIDAVHQTQQEALKVPEHDRHICYIEYPVAHAPVPPGKTDNYTTVELTLFPGRSLDAKRRLYAGIVRRLGELGIAPEDILIVVHEPPLENWGLRGRPASEVDLGFDLNV